MTIKLNAIGSSRVLNSDGSTTVYDAAGVEIETIAADGTINVISDANALPPISVPPIVIASGGTATIDGASDQSVTFNGATGQLTLNDSPEYAGAITGLTGKDAIDLTDIAYGATTTATFLGNTDGGVLTVTDGAKTAHISLTGDYLSSTWTLSSDGSGGVAVVDPVVTPNWQTLKLGAGGYVRGLTVAANGLMIGRTDTNGAYLWNAATSSWTQLITASSMPAGYDFSGMGSGNQGVYEIQIAPTNTNIFYMQYDGAMFKSVNQGTTWTFLANLPGVASTDDNPNDNYGQAGQKMAIDPNNANIVYVGTEPGGLYVTTDGGTTWTHVTGVPTGANAGITGILFDPAIGGTVGGVTQTIFASSYGHGVYQSLNGGATWTALAGGPADVQYAAVSSSGAYYAIGNDSTGNDQNALWKYANGVWTNVLDEQGTSAQQSLQGIAVNPANPNELVVLCAAGNIFVSYDAGSTWSLEYNITPSATDIPWETAGNIAPSGYAYLTAGGIAFNPLAANQIIVSAGTGVWTATVPASGTPSGWDGATVTYTDQSVGIENLVSRQIVVAPGGHPVVASWDRPFFSISYAEINSGAYPTTYGPVNSGNIVEGSSIDYASSNPGFLVGLADWWGTEESGYSTDGGQTWTPFATEIPGAGSSYIGGTIAASTPQDIVWAPAGGNQPYYTLDGGKTWKPVTLPGVSSWSNFDWGSYLTQESVTADRVLANTFYLYYPGQGVFKTTDGGQNWTNVHPGYIDTASYYEGYNSEIQSVANHAGNLFYTGGPQGTVSATPEPEPFFRSTDGGASWTAVANVQDVFCFGFGAAAVGKTYPAIYIVGYVNSVFGVWQSIDNAASWTQIGTFPNGNLDEINTISGDPNAFGQVYVGYSGGGYSYLAATPTFTAVAESPATGLLGAGQTATITLTANENLFVTGAPTLTLNDGGTATYTSGSGTNTLTFTTTVAAGQNSASLAATAINLPNGATINDGASNAVSLSLTGLTQTGPQISASAPVFTSVSETPSSGNAALGTTVTLSLTSTTNLFVAGGVPTLTLNDGGTASYTGGSGTNTLTFTTTVAAGQLAASLAATAINLPTGTTIKDGSGNNASLSLTGLTQTGPQIDTLTPAFTAIAESPVTGDLNVGATITFTLSANKNLTVAGGVPTLTLNDGGIATYTGGSGTTALTFSTTVAAGQNAASLAATAINLPTGTTIKDSSGNAATLSLTGITQAGPQVDTTPPTISALTYNPSSGDINANFTVVLSLTSSEILYVAGGTPTITLNDGGVANYVGGSGTNTLTFNYATLQGQNTPALAATAINLPTGTTINDGAGNAANLSLTGITQTGPQIDTIIPGFTAVTESPATGILSTGATVTITLTGNKPLNVNGANKPTLTLNDGGIATYTGGSGTTALTFTYTVAAGQSTASLAVTAVNLPSGTTITDNAAHTASLSLTGLTQTGPQIQTSAPAFTAVTETPATGDLTTGSTVTFRLTANSNLTVAGGVPTLTLNDGGTATYVSGSGTTALTFSTTIAAGQNAASLKATAVNLPTGTTIKDGSGNTPALSLTSLTQAGPQIDTLAPTFTAVAETPATGDLTTGSTVTFTLTASENVTVAGGAPTLTLNDGGTATYVSGSGTTTLTFAYTVAAGQNTAALAATALNLPTGVTIKDGAGNAASLSLTGITQTGPQVDTTAPTFTAIAESPATGNLTVGATVTFTVTGSETLTIAGGAPTLTLNDGGTATYVSGSGTNVLTFAYTVAASQNTAALAATAINLPTGVTIKDGAGNAASLSLTGITQTGPKVDTTAPTFTAIAESPATGNLTVGATVTFTVTGSEILTVAGGAPTLTLNDGGTATYTGGSGTNLLTFAYTVAAGQNTAALAATALNLPTGVTIKDGAGNPASLSLTGLTQAGPQIDTIAPTFTAIAESPATGDLKAGATVTFTVTGSEILTVAGGAPTLTLNDGGTATYTGGSGTNLLTFAYNVAAGQNTAALAATAINLPTGVTIKDGAGNAASLSLTGITQTGPQIDTIAPTITAIAENPATGDLTVGAPVTFTVTASENVTVAGGAPTLTLNDGGTATYVSGSGTSTLTFAYTVAAGQNTAALAATALNLPTGVTIKDGAGNPASLSLTGITQNGPQVDTTAPTFTAIAENPATGDLTVGATVTFTVTASEAVTIAGGAPTLTLNDGGVATYVSGSGTSALTFAYTVAAGQNTAALTATAINLPTGVTIKDGAGNAASLSLTGITQTGPQIDTIAPTITAIAENPATGDLTVGAAVTFTVAGSETLTVAGGAPTLTLNDGGTATYVSGSGTSTLTFAYTVAAGQNTAALAATAINLPTGVTIKDGAGNAASLSLTGLTQTGPQIDTIAPTITAITESPATGDLPVGAAVTFTVTASEAVTVSGGAPTLTLNDGGVATYVSGSGTSVLTFAYTVAAEQNTAALAATTLNLPTGVTIKDGAGNAANLSLTGLTQTGPQVDTTAPTFTAIAESPATGDLKAGATVTFTVAASENVTVAGGSPTLTLNDGGTATYTGGSGTNLLTFAYTVAAGQNTAALAATALNLPTGVTIKDGAGNAASLSLTGLTQTGPQIDTIAPTITAIAENPATGDLTVGAPVTFTVTASENVTVAGGAPTLTLNDGGTATYVSGSGTSALTFAYTVAASQNTAALAATTLNLPTGVTIKDGAGNAANLSLTGITQNGPQVDTTAPTFTAIAENPATGDLTVGASVTFTVTASEAVTIFGGTPTLTLNDGGVATYVSGSGTSALTFAYTVAAGQNTAALAAAAINLPTGVTIKDGAGNAASLSLTGLTQTGPQIDTIAPTITAITENPATGDLTVGASATFTVTASEAVTVSGGAPTLTLNDGGVATYVSGSGTSVLTFAYTVAAGQNTAALAATALNLPTGVTIKDGAGNAASLSLTGITQTGPQIDTIAPTITAIAETPATGDLPVGAAVTFTVTGSESLIVAGGAPTLTLNDGGVATYVSGSGTSALTFAYTVAAGQNTAALAATAINLPTGVTIKDGAGNAASLSLTGLTQTGPQIDTIAPTFTAIAEGPATGDLTVGAPVTFTVTASEAVTVSGGSPTLTLNDGGIAAYVSGSGSNVLTFAYTVAAGQNTAALAATAINLPTGVTINDGAGNAASLSLTGITQAGPQVDTTAPTFTTVTENPSTGDLTVGASVTFTVTASETVIVSGGVPTLTLNDGGVATYTGGSGTNVLTFAYTVAAGQNTASLAATGVNLPTGVTIKDGAGNAAALSLTGVAQAGPQVDTTTPTIAAITENPATGDLTVGAAVTFTVTGSESLIVAGGTPTLTLNDGGTATYTGGSGTNTLTFAYTVAAGDNAAALTATTLNLPTGVTIKDGAGNAANLSLTGLAQTGPQVDTATPTIAAIAETPATGDLTVGAAVTFTVTGSENLIVTGGAPTLTLNDGGVATYISGSGTSVLTFAYTVAAGQTTAALAATALNLPTGVTINDGAGNAANLSLAGLTQTGPQIDTAVPTITSLTETPSSQILTVGATVTFTLTGSKSLIVSGGTPTLTLNDGGTAAYVSGSGTNTLTFAYIVAPGQNTASLAATAVNLPTGVAIKDAAGNAASLSLTGLTQVGSQIDTTPPAFTAATETPATGNLTIGATVNFTLTSSENLIVAGGAPTLTLNDGGVATYTGGSGTNVLTFAYTVAAGQNTAALAATGVNLPTGVTVSDSAGNAASLSLTGLVQAGPQVDTTPPTITGVVETPPTGSLTAGASVTITLTTSEIVTVAGGAPTLTLNDGGVATYTGGSGTNTLTFSTTVAAGQNTASLAATSLNLPTGVTIKDSAGNATNLSLTGLSQAGPQINGGSAWQTLKIGGGGYVRGLDVSANGVTIGRTDTNGAYLWNAATSSWTQLVTAASLPAAYDFSGMGSGNQGVYEIQAADSNASIFYMQYDGAIFKSVNQGATWTFQTSLVASTADNPNDQYGQLGQKMAIDPNNPNIVYAGTETAGLFVTANGGANWTNVTGVPVGTGAGITGILFDPAIGGTVGGVTQTIFASSYGHGVYQSLNGGATWTALAGGPADVQYAAVSTTGVYYAIGSDPAGHNQAALYSYANGKWTLLYDEGATNDFQAIAVNPANPNELVIANAGGYIFVSYDAGTTWSAAYKTIPVASDIPWETAGNIVGGYAYLTSGGLAFNPLAPNQIILSAGTGFWTANVPASGAPSGSNVTFTDQSVGVENLSTRQIVVAPGGNPVLASLDRPFFSISYAALNSGAYPTTYGPVNSGNIVHGWSIDYASATPSFLVGIADNYGTEQSGYSTNGGQTWTKFTTELTGAGSTFVGGSIAASTTQNFVWAPAGGKQPYYTLNGGTTWTKVTLPGVSSWTGFDSNAYLNQQSVTADRVLANTFYLYDPGKGVFKTTNGGTSWTNVHTGYIDPASYYEGYNSQITAVPNQSGNLFYTGGPQGTVSATPAPEPFYRSTDGGTTWTAVANVQDVFCFGFGAAAPGQSYPAIYIVGYVNSVYGVWQSINNCASWTQIGTFPTGELDTINTISGDPNAFGQVYVGFSGGGYAYLAAAPTFTAVAESPATGTLNAGATVTLTLTATENLIVAGGTPTLTLNDGGTATYTGGSGTNVLTFSYTVGAGDATASLAATAVNLPTGVTIKDGAGNAASLGLTGLAQTGPQIGGVSAPVILSAAVTPATTTLTGNAQPNSTVTLYSGTTKLGTTKTAANGTWTYATPPSLAAAPKTKSLTATPVPISTISATATDARGNVSRSSAPVSVTPSPQSYTINFAANGKPASASYANGVAETWTYKDDKAYKDASTGITGQAYSSSGQYYDANGVQIATVQHMTNGAGNIILSANGLTVTGFVGADTIATGADTFTFNPDTTETVFAAGLTNETFKLNTTIGTVQINGFLATGTSHDVLIFHAASFGLTAANQSADLAALLSHTTQIGGNSIITDTNHGDSLTLAGITKATLAANPGDFKFI